MDFALLSIVIALFFIIIVLFFYLYNVVSVNSEYVFELSKLVSRTFKQYYAREDIEPVVINNGIDLVWKGDVDGTFNESNKLGFITITTNEGNINSPIRDTKEADIIAAKITNVVYDYIQDREEWS